jgi:Bacterial archaeo-eukaryotic release factor family 3
VSETLLAPISLETRQMLSSVISTPAGPRVSVYLPVAPPPDAAQNEVLRRQAVEAVAQRLEALGVQSLEAARRSEMVGAALQESARRASPRGTLVAFASGPEVRCISLVQRLPFLVSVGKRLVLRPLLRALQIEGPYRVLTVSAKQVALFEGDAGGLRRAEQGALPKSLEDALGSEKTEKQLRVRGTGPAGNVPVYYAHHDASQERKIDLQRFHHAIAGALNARLANDAIPLVLATDTTHQSGLHAELRVPGLIEATVTASPDYWTEPQLHEHAWPHVERARASLSGAAPDSWERARNAGKGVDLLDDIGSAAVAGRIRRLWLDGDRALPGSVDPATGRVQSGDREDDVLEALAEIVLCRAGEVRIVTSSALPSATGAAAELR